MKISHLVLFSLIALSGFGCKKEAPVVDVTTPVSSDTVVVDIQPVQYGEPFQHVPATADIVMYEVNFLAFSATKDIKGVQSRLDNLKDLGVNVIWLMPLYPIGDLKGIGSPYAIKNYVEVNPKLGDLEDLRILVEEAHEREIAVILDWVANHTAWDHPWIQNPTWYTRDAFGNIVSPPGMGWNDVADLNYANQEMKSEMIKAMKYWILEANVDGYRCDYAEGVPVDFWKQAIDTLENIPGRELIMFAEAGRKELFSAGFDLIFGWNFYSKLKEVFNDNKPATVLATANTSDYSNIPEGSEILRWIDNHDENAWHDTPLTIFNGERGKIAAFVLASYMGGVPLLYNGQEVAFPKRIPFFSGSASTTINWSLNPEILEEYKKLLDFRNNSAAVKYGTIQTFGSKDVMAFKKLSGNEEVLVLVNVRNADIDFQLADEFEGTSWENAMDGSVITLESSITLPPYSYLILKN